MKVLAKYPPCIADLVKKSSDIASLVAVNIVIVGLFNWNVSIFNRERHSPTLYCLSYKSVRIVVATLSSTIDDDNSELQINATDFVLTFPPGCVCAVPKSLRM